MKKFENPEVYLLLIETAQGAMVIPCSSKEAAENQLKGYILWWWEEEMETEPPEKVTDEHIDAYLTQSVESYKIFPVYVLLEEEDIYLDKILYKEAAYK